LSRIAVLPNPAEKIYRLKPYAKWKDFLCIDFLCGGCVSRASSRAILIRDEGGWALFYDKNWIPHKKYREQW
jgi:hypothetical protein